MVGTTGVTIAEDEEDAIVSSIVVDGRPRLGSIVMTSMTVSPALCMVGKQERGIVDIARLTHRWL